MEQAGNQIRSPEPDRKRCVRALYDGARRETGVAATMTAAKYGKARRNVPWFISNRAVRTNETVVPSGMLKLICAGGLALFERREGGC